jgi:hypothetical protein
MDKAECPTCEYYVENAGCCADVGGFEYDEEGQPYCVDYKPKEGLVEEVN